ncbi:AAA family ATPase [Algoriphagus sp. PAP.12]|uniref:AAA family ATPase n=1 Tax=Algoriphagus sp. PAP.12 TaxID=2996678 RepID=UPI00227CAD25|nr:AAA family ATPase [Algoriphagus sp. PAP.12]
MKITVRNKLHFYVITGGPGVGKTTLLKELESRGYPVVPEVARQLIREQQQIDGEALPWKNRDLYKQMMFDRSIAAFRQLDESNLNNQPVFFDRSFLDTLCYCHLIGAEISDVMRTYAENWTFNPMVFLLPPWEGIYQKDEQRKQDWEEATKTFVQMKETYLEFRYKPQEVPKTDVINRADFVLKAIRNG